MNSQNESRRKDTGSLDSAKPQSDNSPVRELRLLMVGIGLTLIACVFLAVRNENGWIGLQNRIARTNTLAEDVRVVRSLRNAPRGEVPNANAGTDILDSVNAAMQSAGLDAKSLVSTQPQAARPIPGTDVSDVEYRLIFNDLPLDSFARFAKACQSGPQQFRTTGIVLRAAAEGHWNVDLLLTSREQSQSR